MTGIVWPSCHATEYQARAHFERGKLYWAACEPPCRNSEGQVLTGGLKGALCHHLLIPLHAKLCEKEDRHKQDPSQQDMNETRSQANSRVIDLSRLEGEFEGVFSRETIEDLVDTLFDRLAASSRLTIFLPLLVERSARERLRAVADEEQARLGAESVEVD